MICYRIENGALRGRRMDNINAIISRIRIIIDDTELFDTKGQAFDYLIVELDKLITRWSVRND